MRNLKINDGLFGKSYVSTLRNLLNIPDNQFIATNNININAPINVASRVSFQNKGIKLKIHLLNVHRSSFCFSLPFSLKPT